MGIVDVVVLNGHCSQSIVVTIINVGIEAAIQLHRSVAILKMLFKITEPDVKVFLLVVACGHCSQSFLVTIVTMAITISIVIPIGAVVLIEI